ncbi:MAG: UTP--glucose-1-phosphate uridylyltransferase, partial [Myxococcota bacterium]
RDGLLGLPLICNRKTLNPRDPSSPPVFQLETAMGAAIGVIPGAQAICVPRSRFAPVKTTQDLLVVRSDAYLVSPQGTLQLNPESSTPPLVKLDPTFYKMIHDFEQRFPHGPPSLKHCTSLNVKGDVIFGKSVRCIGQVSLHNAASAPQQIPDHTQLPEDNKATPKANPEAL